MTVRYFGRVYELTIRFGENETTAPTRTFDGFNVTDPLQITFMIDQSPNQEHSYAEITIYGLNRQSRKAIYETGAGVILTAGWRDLFGEVFAGEIENVEVGRAGTDTFLRMYCNSGRRTWQTASVFQAFGANTPQLDIIRTVAETFGYPVEFIGDFSSLPRALKGKTLASDSKSLMRQLGRSFGFTWFVQNERMYVVRNTVNRDVPPVRYTNANGIIGSPEIAELGVNIDVLLNPRLRPWDTYTVESETGSFSFGAVYYQEREFPATTGESMNKIVQLVHEGDFYGDTWQTSLTGQRPNSVRVG